MSAAASAATRGVGGGIHCTYHGPPRPQGRIAVRVSRRRAAAESPLGVEALAAVAQARAGADRVFAWDARLEASLIAVLTYLWRRGRGEKWAGPRGLGALRLLAVAAGHGPGADHGLARHPPAQPRPDVGHRLRRHRYDQQVARFVRRHRKSVQRWLAWLQRAGLITHTPQQDEEGFWWRTVIELHPVPAAATPSCWRRPRAGGAPGPPQSAADASAVARAT